MAKSVNHLREAKKMLRKRLNEVVQGRQFDKATLVGGWLGLDPDQRCDPSRWNLMIRTSALVNQPEHWR